MPTAPPTPSPLPRPASHDFGFFGPDAGYPAGGFCISTFLFVRRRNGREVLVGRMREHPRWEAEFAPNLRIYSGDSRKRAFAALRFPATYLRVGEDPRAAATRVWRDELGLEGEPALSEARILSEAGPSRRYPGETHWDVVFSFEAAGDGRDPARGEIWEALEWREVARLREEEFGMSHGEMLAVLSATR